MSVKVYLPDGSERTLESGSTIKDLALSIGPGLAKSAVAGKMNGKSVDLTCTLTNNAKVEIITASSAEGLEVIRHSTAHLLAMALQELYPGLQITIGPVVENQFYYDVLPPGGLALSTDDFPAIEKKMDEIVARDLPVKRVEYSRSEAVEKFKKLGEYFKVELVQDIPDGEPISVYEMGSWYDLCRGPHVPSTGKLGAFKLMSIAGAYWRANKDREQLTRIYGTAWANKKDLAAYLTMLEEAKKRDHVALGKQLDLFSLHSDIAPGAPFFHPKGQKLFVLLQSYIRKQTKKYGFIEIQTPQIMNVDLWKTSGHYDNFRDNMYFIKDEEGENYAVKPMSCPGHVRVFSTGLKSYRDLPIRFAEFGIVHRNELSGTLHGLTRVRRITQDDGHIFCTIDQIGSEMENALKLAKEVYGDLGFHEVKHYLSTRPEKRMGSDDLWDMAEKSLSDALKKQGIDYILNPGDGAFYGPKIDFKVKDAIGRLHQLATIQLDFQMPGRFEAYYISPDNSKQTPVMIHRAVLGSLERFMGVFIEHCAGHFPIGLAPTQVRLINVTEAQAGYVQEVENILKNAGVRVDSDLSNEKLGYKIRNAQLVKIPYMVVIGDKEAQARTLQPRYWDGTNLDPYSPEKFVEFIKEKSSAFWGLDTNQN